MLNNITGCTSRFHSEFTCSDFYEYDLPIWHYRSLNIFLQNVVVMSWKLLFQGNDQITLHLLKPSSTILPSLIILTSILNKTTVVHIPAPAWGTNTEIPYWCVTTQIWVQGIVLLTGWTFALTNQKHYSGLGSDTSSVSVSWKSTSWGVNTCRSYFSAMHENVASRHEQVGIR